ncbi:MAG: hypothetical protein WCJ35_09325 [Planctomycetota bacterium]
MHVTALAPQQFSRLRKCERIIARGEKTFLEVGRALMEIKQEKLYIANGTFADYCKERWGFERNYAKRLMNSAEVIANLGNVPIGTFPATESLARPLASLPADQQANVWADMVDECKERGVPITAAVVAEIVEAYHEDVDKEGEPEPEPTFDSDPQFVLCVALARLEKAIVAEISGWPEDRLIHAKDWLIKLAGDI